MTRSSRDDTPADFRRWRNDYRRLWQQPLTMAALALKAADAIAGQLKRS
jgi:hypothetical protein